MLGTVLPECLSPYDASWASVDLHNHVVSEHGDVLVGILLINGLDDRSSGFTRR